MKRLHSVAAAMAAIMFCLAFPSISSSQELTPIRVGRPDATSLTSLPVIIGETKGIWKQVGLDLQTTSLRGDAQVQQALAAGSIDVALGSGPGMAFLTKGVPAMVISSLVGQPNYFALIVAANSPLKTIADMRNKRIGVSSVGSLSSWLAQQIAVKQGWPASAIVIVPLGEAKGQIAGLKTGAVDAIISGADSGYDLEEHQQGHVLLKFDSIVQHFPTNVLYARTEFINQHPDIVNKFLVGWFRCVAYMKMHKAETVKIAAEAEGLSETAMIKAYDALMPAMSSDGNPDKAAFEKLSQSLTDLGLITGKVDLSQYIAKKFVPVKI